MKSRSTALLLALILAGGTTSAVRADEPCDWNVWRSLPVQQGGRQKPLDTLARESLRNWSNRSSLVDPQSGERLEPTAVYVTLLLEWRGWQHPDRQHLRLAGDWRSLYFPLHAADRWDDLPLLRVEDRTLRDALSVTLEGNAIAPRQLAEARIKDYRRNREVPFPAWAENVAARNEAGDELAEIEQHGLELAQRLWSYQNHRMARGLELLPLPTDESGPWLTLARLLVTQYDDPSDPTGQLRAAQSAFTAAGNALEQGDHAAFNRESHQFVQTLGRLRAALGGSADQRRLDLEVAYNRWAPFRIAWVLMLVAALGFLSRAVGGPSWFGRAALGAYGGGLIAMIAGFTLRCLIAGRPPVTNMYESIVYVGASVAILGLVFSTKDRRSPILAAAATIATLALILADCAPLVLDPSLRPLEPVLRSNFWLVTHVLTITLSYAALALAVGLGNISLGYSLVRSKNEAAIAALGRHIYRVLQFGVLLLAAGIVLGGVWADYSWGRFWGWDPKEVWALVALLGYLAVLHARYVGWVEDRGLALLAVVCFALVVMGWYGVNFVLGVGLHSYGFGGGGQRYVYAGIVAQILYALVAVLRSPETERRDDVHSREGALSPSPKTTA